MTLSSFLQSLHSFRKFLPIEFVRIVIAVVVATWRWQNTIRFFPHHRHFPFPLYPLVPSNDLLTALKALSKSFILVVFRDLARSSLATLTILSVGKKRIRSFPTSIELNHFTFISPSIRGSVGRRVGSAFLS